jgi:LPXTG-site transpeptidase (sortase) family protein
LGVRPYDLDGVAYLGIAHGWAGLVYAALRFARVVPDAARPEVAPRLEQLADCAEPWGRGVRWRISAADERPSYMSGWCNGSAGHVHLWTLANELDPSPRHLDLARAAGWNAWEDGGQASSVCCGLAGRAYALLALHRATGDRRWGPPKGYAPGPGAPVFKLRIPAIHITKIVVEGVDIGELALGPGHYPSCRKGFSPPLCTKLPEIWPGERGRVIVSGHRTTHDHPFYDLDKLEKGDQIITVTKWGTFVYGLTHETTVSPNSTTIANPAATHRRQIVLTTCNPKYSAAQRLVAFANLEKVR